MKENLTPKQLARLKELLDKYGEELYSRNLWRVDLRVAALESQLNKDVVERPYTRRRK